MALTRAQLLSGNQSNGVVLPGQPQGVIAGPGISISNTGIISVDSSSVTGLVKLNDPFAYNSYVWPGADGTAGEFLQTDGAGNLDWATPQGFAVVTVQPQPAPVPSDVGELWFDCSTGTLNVYQDCVGGTGWFNVAQPGFPVLPGSTSALPPFTNQGTPGAGTQANPYDCTITTVPSGSSTFIVNTVTVTGLAPFQYVPIVDLNAVTNLGRFSFSNYYANSSGVLTFQVIFKDLPPSGGGISYTAAIRVGYASAYIEAIVNTTLPLTLSGGNIAGTPTSGTPVAFTPPTASGGSGGYTYAYQWFADGLPIFGATNSTFTPTTAEVGKTLSVTTTVTDSSGASASTTTTASSQTASSPISNWAATGSMTTIPGGLSGVYTGTGTNITVTGCIESAVYTPPAVPTFNNSAKPITSGQTLAIRWSTSLACGGAASGTPISGTVTDGIGTNSYNTTVNRIPSPAIGDITSTNVALNGTVSQGIASPILGLNTTAYVTYVGTSTGGTIGASLTPGGPFTPLATSGTGFQINNLQTLYIEQTVGGTVNTSPGYTAIIRVGDGTNTAGTYDEFTYTATTVNTATFPGLVFSPAGGPNASPASVSLVGPPALEGTATATGGWPAASPSPASLTVTGGIQISINGAAYVGAGGPYSISTGQSLSVIWDPAAVTAAADNATLTGSITDGTYTNTFSMVVDRAVDPASFAFTDVDPVALNSTNTSATVTPSGFNVPVSLSYTGTASNPMTGILAAVGTGGFLASPQTVNPGDGIQLQGIAGGTVSTVYGIDATIGSGPAATDTWTTKTTAASPAVAQPTISTPNAGATGQGTASGITITSSPYSASGGAGTHASSNWELYANSYPLQSTNVITAVGTAAPGSWVSPASATSTYYGGGGNDGTWMGAAGPNGTAIQYSSDNGTTWSSVASAAGTYPRSFAKAGNVWVAAGNDGTTTLKIARSTNDGTAWTVTHTGGTGTGLVATDGNTFSVPYANGSSSVGVRYSTDAGLTWSSGSLGVWNAGANIYQVIFAAGKFIVVGEYGQIAYSTNGQTYTRVNGGTPAEGNFFGVAYGNGTYVAINGSTGQAWTSSNGLAWTNTSATPFNARSIAYVSGQGFVIGNAAGRWATSPNGTTWTDRGTVPSTSFYGMGSYGLRVLGFGVSSPGSAAYNDMPFGGVQLTIAGCQTEGFLVGDTVVSVAAGGGPATILSLDDTQVTVTSSTGWLGNSTQFLARATSSYTLAASATNDTVNKESWPVAKPPLAAFTTYYVRVQYTSNATVVTSAWSPWREFTTGSLTAPLNGWTTAYTGAAGFTPRQTVPVSGSAFVVDEVPSTPTGSVFHIRSADGVNFTRTSTSGFRSDAGAVYYSPIWSFSTGTFLQGTNSTATQTYATTSNSGTTWSVSPARSPYYTQGAGGSSNYVWYTFDGATTQWRTNPVTGVPGLGSAVSGTLATDNPSSLGIIEYSTGNWLVFGSAGGVRRLYKSTDNGANWTTSVSNVSSTYGFTSSAVAGQGRADVNGNTIMFVGNTTGSVGAVLRSTDGGATWNTVTVGSTSLNGIAYGGGRWVAIAGTNTFSSTDDGATWASGPALPNTGYGISYSPSAAAFVVVSDTGSNTVIYTSN